MPASRPHASGATRVVAGLSLPPTNYVKRGRISQRASLFVRRRPGSRSAKLPYTRLWKTRETAGDQELVGAGHRGFDRFGQSVRPPLGGIVPGQAPDCWTKRSEEHTSELQSLMRISYAVFCLKK